MFKIISWIFVGLIATLLGAAFSVNHQSTYSRGSFSGTKKITIDFGENSIIIGKKLEEEGIIDHWWYLPYSVWKENAQGKTVAGNYEMSGQFSPREIVRVITTGESKPERITITFPEGWPSDKMAERLNANDLPGDDFLEIVRLPSQEIINRYWLLSTLSENGTLEGYLFPDTYFIDPTASAEDIVTKMLVNFERKFNADLRQKMEDSDLSMNEVVTMASVIEGEVRSLDDKRLVSGLFWNRIENGQPLQSCATIAFVLGEKKDQYSFDDTRVPSPYNTYINKGLPPFPISNPGLEAISATLEPTSTEYNYFLSDPKTGATIFSRTLDEHNANKVKYGL